MTIAEIAEHETKELLSGKKSAAEVLDTVQQKAPLAAVWNNPLYITVELYLKPYGDCRVRGNYENGVQAVMLLDERGQPTGRELSDELTSEHIQRCECAINDELNERALKAEAMSQEDEY